MTPRVLALLLGLVGLAASAFVAVVVPATAHETSDAPRERLPRFPEPTDHAAYFTRPFADGPAVTRTCLTCHPDAAREVKGTAHWTWQGGHGVRSDTGEAVAFGKRNVLNNFCIAVPSNWPRCTSCHAGYGWEDASFDPAQAADDRVDCLVCHDGSGQYAKDPQGAGRPDRGVDLLAAARSVGRSSRATCGTCHFKGGGGDAVKHGDLDETMRFPPDRVDVHMGRHGLRCADCHRAEGHRIRGRLMPTDADGTRVRCEDCHAAAPHGDERIDLHLRAVACTTCHVPTFAAETPTKMWWDWSKAGRDGDPEAVAHAIVADTVAGGAEGRLVPPAVLALFRRVGTDPDVSTHYDKKKGLFLLAREQVPEYRWYDGTSSRHLPGERFDGDGPVPLNPPHGRVGDPAARIVPFKVHRGVQPFDAELRHLLVPHTFGPGGYWSAFDWERALVDGAKASGIAYSGHSTWRSTEMVWPQNHMVRPKTEALRCTDCHGDGGRLDWAALGYPGDPAVRGGRVAAGLLDVATRPGATR
ncbi:MAG: cytochrome C [Planctomycetes bacterium]|nr:cytochrome C [Planctomycetota bacterium]